jgi:hypothetical protein
MTHEVEFHASQAALWHVRYSLKTYPPKENNPFAYLAAGTACILCCSTGLEALVNETFLCRNIISPWDELKLASKIDVIFESQGKQVDWGKAPFQTVGSLIRIRNWLAHHKEPYLGLSNAEGEWVADSRGRRRPRIDIERELEHNSVRRYYDSVREVGIQIADLFGDDYTKDWLTKEDYWPLAT